MLSRDPRRDPRVGDVLVRLGFGGPAGCRFRVTQVGPHRTHGEQVVCHLTRADGGPVPHPTRCYSRSGWLQQFAGSLVAVIAGACPDD